MTKRSFFTACLLASLILFTGFSSPAIKHDKHPDFNKKPCNVTMTFYNNGTIYTIPWVSLSDSFTDDTDTNIAPSGTTVLSIAYAGGSLEFNVQFSGKHPAGRVKLFKNNVEIDCDLIASNSNIVTIQTDSSPSCGDTYELKFEQITTC